MKRRKKGKGAEERRWLRRRLEEAEARVAALQEERRQLRRVMRRRDEQEKEEQEYEQEYEMSRIDGRVVGHACGVVRGHVGGLHLGAGGPLNSHLTRLGTSGEEKEEEQESEEQETAEEQGKVECGEERYEQEGDLREEMVMAGVSGMEGRYDSEGDEEEQVRGWGSVGSDSNELMEEYEAYGGGTGGSDEEGLVEEWSGSDGSDEVVAAREGSSGDGLSGEVVMMMWEEDLMEGIVRLSGTLRNEINGYDVGRSLICSSVAHNTSKKDVLTDSKLAERA